MLALAARAPQHSPLPWDLYNCPFKVHRDPHPLHSLPKHPRPREAERFMVSHGGLEKSRLHFAPGDELRSHRLIWAAAIMVFEKVPHTHAILLLLGKHQAVKS